MSKLNKNKASIPWVALLVILPILDFILLIKILLKDKNVALFNPQGEIAQKQFDLMIFTVAVFLVVAIPTLFILYFMVWKYRASNTNVARTNDGRHGKKLDVGLWLIPATILVILASVMWPATHDLAPQKAINSDVKPIRVQVIALRWKWVFLYPEQNIATVNFVQVPKDRPIEFDLTSDESPMSSFWIPNIGGQLYTMTSHVNRLNLVGNTIGDFPGSSAELNGAGFSGMKFTTRVSSEDDFETWVNTVQQTPDSLDKITYKKLLNPSENNPVEFFNAYDKNIYDTVVAKYMGSHGRHSE